MVRPGDPAQPSADRTHRSLSTHVLARTEPPRRSSVRALRVVAGLPVGDLLLRRAPGGLDRADVRLVRDQPVPLRDPPPRRFGGAADVASRLSRLADALRQPLDQALD